VPQFFRILIRKKIFWQFFWQTGLFCTFLEGQPLILNG